MSNRKIAGLHLVLAIDGGQPVRGPLTSDLSLSSFRNIKYADVRKFSEAESFT